MSAKIKCSYADCFKHFNTYEAMKKHKAKDSAHDFHCKKCDVDCNDDMELLYHQITSERHVACPICGREFKSESGRDRHVEIDHVPKQNITCVGCQTKFDRASSLMAHIEGDECEVIRLEHFQRQKAEKQVAQDAWAAATDPTAGATILSYARAFPPADSEMNLLDDERAYVNTDWQGRPQYDEENERNGPYVDPPSEQMSNLSISRYPPLGPQSPATKQGRLPLITDPGSDLVDLDADPASILPNPIGAWSSSDSAARLFNTPASGNSNFNTKDGNQPPPPTSTTTSINLLDTFTNDDLDRHPDHRTTNPSSTHPQPNTSTHPLPPSATAPNTDPNYLHAHLRTTHSFTPPNALQISTFHDPVLNTYICPTPRCARHFSTPQAFSAHLLAPPHTGGPVTCPGCYKRFKTTTALLSHMESGSRKCRVRDALDFDRVVRVVTAGLVAADGITEEGGVGFRGVSVEDW